jgi:hypothetical protein
VFSSNGDLDSPDTLDPVITDPGVANSDASREVFLYSLRKASQFPTQSTFTQVTNGPAGTASGAPRIGGLHHASPMPEHRVSL